MRPTEIPQNEKDKQSYSDHAGQNVRPGEKKLVVWVRPRTPAEVAGKIKSYLRKTDLVLGPAADESYPGFVKATKLYGSAKQLLDDLPGLGHGVTHVIYDPEHWPATPDKEQENLVEWARCAAEATWKSGRIFMLTPDARFNREMGEKLAPFADIYDLQGQAGQAKLDRYSDYYRTTVPKIRKANPKALVLTQIGVARPDSSAEQALEAWDRVKDLVDGVLPWYSPEEKSLGELLKVLEALRPGGAAATK